MGGRRKSVLTDQQYLKIRDATPVEAAVKSEFAAANQLLQNFVRDDTGVGMYVPDELKDAVFCGHLVADLRPWHDIHARFARSPHPNEDGPSRVQAPARG